MDQTEGHTGIRPSLGPEEYVPREGLGLEIPQEQELLEWRPEEVIWESLPRLNRSASFEVCEAFPGIRLRSLIRLDRVVLWLLPKSLLPDRTQEGLD